MSTPSGDRPIDVKRRDFMGHAALGLGPAAWTTAGAAPAGGAGAAEKVLRIAFPAPESTFDPPSTNSDFYSTTLISQILEAPLTFDYLARPARLPLPQHPRHGAHEIPDVHVADRRLGRPLGGGRRHRQPQPRPAGGPHHR